MTTTTDMMRVHILLNGWAFGTAADGRIALWRSAQGACVTTMLQSFKVRGRTKYKLVAYPCSFPYTRTEPEFIPFDDTRAFYQYVCMQAARADR